VIIDNHIVDDCMELGSNGEGEEREQQYCRYTNSHCISDKSAHWCVLMTADYEILLPDESMVLTTIQHSTAKKFVDDPIATLRKLGQPEIQKRFNYPMKDKEP